MFGVTTPCVHSVRERLEAAGFEVLVFHATGTGGQAMEQLIRDGLIRGVADVTTTELADELVGGILSAGPHRLEIAGQLGIPQVISVGALDMVNFGPRDSVPERFQGRTFYQHNRDRHPDADHGRRERPARPDHRRKSQCCARAGRDRVAAAGRLGDRRGRAAVL